MLAELLELAPGGVEESEDGDVVEYAVYGAPGELPALPDLRAAAGGALVEVTHERGARRLGRALEGLPSPGAGRRPARAPAVAAAARGPARRRHRPCSGLRHGRAPDHAPVPGAAARARARRGARRRRLRLGRARHRRGAAGVGAGARHRPRARVGAGHARQRGRQRRVPCRHAATTYCATGRPRARRPSWPTCCARCCCASRRTASPAPQPDVLVASGLLAHEGDEVAAAFARHGLRETERRHGGEWVALLLRR